jgi:hypothetical protein
VVCASCVARSFKSPISSPERSICVRVTRNCDGGCEDPAGRGDGRAKGRLSPTLLKALPWAFRTGDPSALIDFFLMRRGVTAPEFLLSVNDLEVKGLGVASTLPSGSNGTRRLRGMGERASRGLDGKGPSSSLVDVPSKASEPTSSNGTCGNVARGLCNGIGDTLRGPPGRRSLDVDAASIGIGDSGRSSEGEKG